MAFFDRDLIGAKLAKRLTAPSVAIKRRLVGLEFKIVVLVPARLMHLIKEGAYRIPTNNKFIQCRPL